MSMTFSQASSQKSETLFTELQSSAHGLRTAEVQLRLARDGKNELSQQQVRWWQIILRQFKSPFIYLLIGAALLSFLLREWTDGLMILLFITINAVLGFSQEYHSEKTIRLLKQFVGSSCRVLRDQQRLTIPSTELVVGDIVHVVAGDIIPADLRFLRDQNLNVDESTFTGESMSVKKTSDTLSAPTEQVYQATNCGFSGSIVVSGEGDGIVFATGANTAIGSLTKLTVETVRESSFEKGIARFSQFILKLVLVTLLLVIGLHLIFKPSQTPLLELFLFAIALAVSVIPEALPVVMTVCLSKGARRLASHHVVVKRLSAIEDLGGIEVLCTDKTGTLTQNKLTLVEVYGTDRARCLQMASLASTVMGDDTRQPNNSFDIAIWRALSDTERAQARLAQRLAQIPFDPHRRRSSVLVRFQGDTSLIVRGAPEHVLHHLSLAPEERTAIQTWLTKQGQQGRRVLAVSRAPAPKQDHYTPEAEEQKQTLLGIIAFEDPIKPTASHAITQAKTTGVLVKILTGDHPDVARAVAMQVGLVGKKDPVITGEEWDRFSHDQRTQAVETCQVFARVSPEQKYHIIQHLEETHAVGFLGEGINDAPALKMAHVGIVVKEASDVAREAADVILLENSLDVIVQGIQEGREVFANTVKYIRMTLAANFGNFYAIAAASFFIDYLPLLPVQILLVNLLSDFPMIAIATDHVDAQELRRPRSYDVRDTVIIATVLGLVSTIFDFVFFAVFRHRPSEVLQTQWFIGSILTELAFLYSIRTRLFFLRAKGPSLTLALLTFSAAVCTVVIPFTSFGARIFSFFRPRFMDLFISLSIVAIYFITTEVVKLLYVRLKPTSEETALRPPPTHKHIPVTQKRLS